MYLHTCDGRLVAEIQADIHTYMIQEYLHRWNVVNICVFLCCIRLRL